MKIGWLMTMLLGGFLVTAAADARQEYPVKPIRLIVPFAPGGPSDVMARLFAQKLTEALGQAVIVDNRPGGGATIGTETAVKAQPDGYTMIVVSGAYAANAALYRLPYDSLRDVAPVALIGEASHLVSLHPSVPVSSVRELMAYAKAHPGKLGYGSGGTGGDIHLGTELFNQMTGCRMTHVPYKGTGPALNDLLGGQIQVIFGALSVMLPHVKSNRLRGIAVTATTRSSAVPDLPAVAETVPGYDFVQWNAILGPKGLAADIVLRWNREIDRILRISDVKERMTGFGMEAAGGPPERFQEVLKREVRKWQDVVRVAKIDLGS